GEARRYIIDEIKDKCDSIETDALGNVIAYKGGADGSRRLMLGTNTDEAGFIVTDITEDGYIKFGAVGDIDPRTVVSKRVVIGKDRVKGVIGMKAVHVTTREERETAVKLSELYIDIGAANKKKAQKRVKKGDYIAFDTRFETMGECIRGKALDRFGTVCLIEAMDEAPAYDTYFVFSAQRETGGRGMKVAAYNIKPDTAVIVDTVSTEDQYKSKHPAARLGSGAVIEYMDRTNISDTKLTAKVAELAKESGIAAQDKLSSAAKTVAGAVTESGAVTACIGIPVRYSHTPACMMNKKDIDDVTALCKAIVKEGV
ncbi:MAG: M42 family peptidase, partial [Clostridia bacterium]|nr:M42 family peptidase [Clostridia bacterium]